MKSFPLITIHSDFYERRFLCKRHNTGYLFSVIVMLIVLFFPFITTYSSGSKCHSDLKI